MPHDALTKLIEGECLEHMQRIQRLQRLLGDDKVDGMDLSCDDNDNAASVEPVAKKRRVEKAVTTAGKNKVMLRNDELARLPVTARFLWKVTEGLGGVLDCVPVTARKLFNVFKQFNEDNWEDAGELGGFFQHLRSVLLGLEEPEEHLELDAAVHGLEGINQESELVFNFAALRWRVVVLYLAPRGARPVGFDPRRAPKKLTLMTRFLAQYVGGGSKATEVHLPPITSEFFFRQYQLFVAWVVPKGDMIAGDALEFHRCLCDLINWGLEDPSSATPNENWEECGVSYNKDIDCFVLFAPSLEAYLMRKHGLAKRGV